MGDEPSLEPEAIEGTPRGVTGPAELSPFWRRVVLASTVVTGVSGAVAIALLPKLLVDAPMLLLVLMADAKNLVLVAPRLGLPLLLCIGVPRRVLGMMISYGIGRVYGRAILAWGKKRSPWLARWTERIEARFAGLAAPLLVVWPAQGSSVLSGVSGVPFRWFSYWMCVGQIAYVTVIFFIGDALAAPIEKLTTWLSEYVWETTLLLTSLVIGFRLFGRARKYFA